MGSGVEHYQSLKGFACVLGLQIADAEDAVQDAYLSHLKGKKKGTIVRHDRAYLARCVSRGATRKKINRQREVSLNRIPEQADRGYRARTVSRFEEIERVRSCIAQLPPLQAFIIDALMEGRKRAEVLAVLAISPATYHRHRIAAIATIGQALTSE